MVYKVYERNIKVEQKNEDSRIKREGRKIRKNNNEKKGKLKNRRK